MSVASQEQAFFAKKQSRLLIGFGVIALPLGLFMILTSPAVPVAPVGLGALMLGMGCWFYFSPVIRFADDHIAFSPAPLARTRTILDSEIQRIEQKKKVIVVHYRRHDDNPEKPARKLGFPMNMLTADDREACMSIFATRFDLA
ncbi:hypothetical protein [Chromohalobacter nigrandesensis]|uniref:hypothetical protein n=1 Tax=Chromohalobacter nigrandesensis TaxID=119863 RepID=UPI001FF342B1|nr:hypothetical protein [Chromohalobacter nigrandesensis]MCK0746310.1 hypothetical protein [Chromohalobacter nigrandesensis]